MTASADTREVMGEAARTEEDPSTGEVTLPSLPESARYARQLVRRLLVTRWRLAPELTDHAVLLVSELVANAVRHAGAGSLGLRVRRRRGWLRVELTDPSRALPCLLPVRELDITGRGLFLVNELSDRWGVDLLPDGKSTWFEMRVPVR
ncbi:ATP-binding protein [Streptomyces sp. RFCAC02]|uniref:ATP-binding protein n=1 Tax=Streptomyces sp. RFCAC02 TaxID=2499143 RepID=UPI001F11799C|nr:ATP-binding protein [Streptomyces sp. RFCAC02]